VHGAAALVLGYQRAFEFASLFAFAGALVSLAFLSGRVKAAPPAAAAAAAESRSVP
jgi:hypothetical protein